MLRAMATGVVGLVLGCSAALADVAANKALVQEMMAEVFAARDASKVDTYFTEDYIQHNPLSKSGREPLKKLIARMSQGVPSEEAPYTMHRILGDGDLVATHSTLRGLGSVPLVAFDIFRIEDGMIAEHWDNLIPVQPANPSGRTQMDGATEVVDLDQTETNRALVVELLEKMFIGEERIDVTQYIRPVTYLQHNPQVEDGLAGLQAFMKANAEQGIKMAYDEVHLTVAEGNFVLTASSGSLNDVPTAFYDFGGSTMG